MNFSKGIVFFIGAPCIYTASFSRYSKTLAENCIFLLSSLNGLSWVSHQISVKETVVRKLQLRSMQVVVKMFYMFCHFNTAHRCSDRRTDRQSYNNKVVAYNVPLWITKTKYLRDLLKSMRNRPYPCRWYWGSVIMHDRLYFCRQNFSYPARHMQHTLVTLIHAVSVNRKKLTQDQTNRSGHCHWTHHRVAGYWINVTVSTSYLHAEDGSLMKNTSAEMSPVAHQANAGKLGGRKPEE